MYMKQQLFNFAEINTDYEKNNQLFHNLKVLKPF